nr:hypothetical protein CFP56_03796 [Quercus suber]
MASITFLIPSVDPEDQVVRTLPRKHSWETTGPQISGEVCVKFLLSRLAFSGRDGISRSGLWCKSSLRLPAPGRHSSTGGPSTCKAIPEYIAHEVE